MSGRMTRLVPGAVAVAAALAVAPAAFATRADSVPQTSANWAGYAVADATTVSTGTTDPTQTAPLQFTSVTATWKLPRVTCDSDLKTYSAFWVGLGGFSSDAQSLEQIGTDSDCASRGHPVFYAWYELVPAPSVRLGLKVGGGDTITTSVNVNGTDVLVQIKDRSRKTSFTRHLHMDAPDLSSAEWITEAPSECATAGFCRQLPLANFGSVGFTRIATIANGHPGVLTDPTWSSAAISLIPDARSEFFGSTDAKTTAGATPAAVSADGRSFAVGFTPHAGG
jgi:hypothetical protein